LSLIWVGYGHDLGCDLGGWPLPVLVAILAIKTTLFLTMCILPALHYKIRVGDYYFGSLLPFPSWGQEIFLSLSLHSTPLSILYPVI
jgi:hypothetical protein